MSHTNKKPSGGLASRADAEFFSSTEAPRSDDTKSNTTESNADAFPAPPSYEVEFTVNDRIRKAVQMVSQFKADSNQGKKLDISQWKSLAAKWQSKSEDAVMSLSQIKELSAAYQTVLKAYGKPTEPGYVHVLTHGSEIKPLPIATKRRQQDPEFLARLEQLKRMADDREYQELTKDLEPASKRALRFVDANTGQPISVKNEIGMGVNVLALMATGFAVFYYIGQSMFPHHKIAPMAFGLVGLFLAMMLEIVLFMVRDTKQQLAEAKAKKKGAAPFATH